MNVLHIVSPMGSGEVGGAERHALDLAVAQRGGAAVRPVLLELGDKGFARLAAGHGVRAVTIAHPYAVTAIARARRTAVELEIDVVHSHGYDADFLATTLGQRRPLVATTHGFVRVSPRTRCKTMLNERCLRRFDAVIATSSSEAARLRLLVGRAAFVPNGVVVPARVTPRQSGVSTIGFCGRLSPEKRPDLFLEAAAILALSPQPRRFLAAGSGPLLAALTQSEGPVQLLGVVDEVEAFYDRLHVLVCSSDSEGTPRAVLEAMARGIPVVATSVGGLPDIVEHRRTGMLVAPGSATLIANAVQELLADGGLYAAIAAAARSVALRSFTIEQMSDRVEAIYRSTKNIVSSP